MHWIQSDSKIFIEYFTATELRTNSTWHNYIMKTNKLDMYLLTQLEYILTDFCNIYFLLAVIGRISGVHQCYQIFTKIKNIWVYILNSIVTHA